MYLFFDTETTGLPRSRRFIPPEVDPDNWPRVVQLAWGIYDDQGKERLYSNEIIRPDAFDIPEKAASIHGITTERALEEGRPIEEILPIFTQQLIERQYLVAHNLDFDINVLSAEYYRYQVPHRFGEIEKICTMKSKDVIDFCKFPNPYRSGYKWPRLSQLHCKLFDADFEDAHNALEDVRATARCFFELKRREII